MARGGLKSPFKKAANQRHRAWGQAVDICRDYLAGSAQTGLGDHYGCSADVIHDILVANNVAIVARGRGASDKAINVANAAYDPPFDAALLVDRDPCPRCETRADIGCRHSYTRLGTAFGLGGAGHGGEVITA